MLCRMSNEITDVRTWWARPRLIDGSLALLDKAEHERFKSYRRDIDRARFLTGTLIVRHVYAADLGISPLAVPLIRHCPNCDRPHGKVRGPGRLEVSVSHSGSWVVVAACRDHPVGVDVEQVDPTLDHAALLRLVATEEEATRLESNGIPGPTAFACLWTRKEAVLKALADGLRTPMNDFAVSAPGERPAVIGWPSRPDLPGRLQLHDLDADVEHAAALAVLDSPGMLRVLPYAAADLWSGFIERP
jgi:4'-phosphopantetheinyl transferase